MTYSFSQIEQTSEQYETASLNPTKTTWHFESSLSCVCMFAWVAGESTALTSGLLPPPLPAAKRHHQTPGGGGRGEVAHGRTQLRGKNTINPQKCLTKALI